MATEYKALGVALLAEGPAVFLPASPCRRTIHLLRGRYSDAADRPRWLRHKEPTTHRTAKEFRYEPSRIAGFHDITARDIRQPF